MHKRLPAYITGTRYRYRYSVNSLAVFFPRYPKSVYYLMGIPNTAIAIVRKLVTIDWVLLLYHGSAFYLLIPIVR